MLSFNLGTPVVCWENQHKTGEEGKHQLHAIMVHPHYVLVKKTLRAKKL